MDSNNFPCFSFPEISDCQHRLGYYGFIYYDYLLSWSPKASEYLRRSSNDFKHWVDMGCLWASHIKLIRDQRIPSDFNVRLLKRGYNKESMKLISVFDSTYHDYIKTTYVDGIRFIEDILKLLERMPDVFVVLKEKRKRANLERLAAKSGELLKLYDALDRHPRGWCLAFQEDSSELMAFSDLTISYPYSSTTYEALSARRKAIWHDPTHKFRNTFYDGIPGLVSHSYDELAQRVDELLFQVEDGHYDAYLNKYVEGAIESHLEGNALARFRQLLRS